MEYSPGKKPQKKHENVAHKRTEPQDALERREQKKKKQPEEKEATKNMKKGRTPLKRSNWRKASEQAPTKALRSERNPQSK